MIFYVAAFLFSGFFFTSSNLDDTFCLYWLIAFTDTYALTGKNKRKPNIIHIV